MNSQSFTILAIDDKPDNLVVLKALLSEAFPNATLLSAQSGKEGLALCISGKPDIILLDIVMPGMDGYEVCSSLKSNPLLKHIPVVMLTATSASGLSRIKALDIGADAFLAKPVDEAELTAQVRAMLRIKDSVDQKQSEKERLEEQVKERTAALEKELLVRGKAEEALQGSLYRLEKSRSAELNLLEDLRNEIIQRRDAEEKVTAHLTEQKLISEVSKKLVGISSREEIYKYIGERIFEIAGDAYVFVATYDSDKHTVQVKHLFGFGKLLGKIRETLNINIFDISVSIDYLTEEVFSIYKSTEMVNLTKDGFYTLTAGTINKNICRAAEKLLGIKEMSVMGFASDEMYFGGVGVFSKKNKATFKQHRLVENLVNQASVALQKLYAQEELRQEHDNLNAILSSSPVAMLVMDEKEHIVRINPAAKSLFNKDFSELNDSSYCDFLNCVNRYDNTDGCGSSLQCNLCKVSESVRSALSNRLQISDQEVPMTIDSAEGNKTVWIKYSIQPLMLNGRQHIILSFHDNTISKLAEEEIRRTEKHFRSLIERAPDGVVLIGRDGNFKYVSPSALRIFGYGSGMPANIHPSASTHPEDLPFVLDNLSELIKNPVFLPTIEYRFRHADGSWRWIASTFSNMLSEPGVEAIVINFRDITDRKVAEQALAYSEKRFRSLIENSADAIVLTDAQGNIIYESPAYFNISGRRAKERIGKHSFEFIHPGDKPVLEKMLREVLDKPLLVQHITVRNQHKDGSWRWSDCTITNMLEEPAIQAIAINIHDITKQTQAREAMRMSEAKYRGLFESNKDGISIFYLDENEQPSNFVEVNAAAAQMIGYTKKEMLNFSAMELEIGSDNNMLKKRKKQVQKSGYASEETKIRHKNGTDISVELLVVPIQYNDRIALMNIVRDITERKRSEAALSASEAKYRKLHESMMDGYVFADMAGHVKDYNESYKNMLGFSDQELLSFSVSDLTPDKWHEFEKKIIMEQIIAKGFSGIYEKEYRKKDGTIFPVELRTYLIKNDKGENEGMWAIVRDITERKRSEQALLESRQQLMDIIDFLPDATFVVDNQKTVIAWNKAIEEMTGVLKKDIIGKGEYVYSIPFYGNKQKQLIDILDNDDKDLVARYSNLKWKGQLLSAEIFAPALYNGKGAYISAVSAPLLNSLGERVGSIESIRDVTDRKKSEMLIETERLRLRTVIETIPDLVWLKDPEGIYIQCNPVFEQYFGATENELIGKSDFDFELESKENAVASLKRDKDLMASDSPTVYHEWVISKADGQHRLLETIKTPMYDAGQKLVGILGVARDITALYQSQESLREREEIYSAIVNQANDSIVLVDIDSGAFVEFNDASCFSLGYSREEFAKLTIRNIEAKMKQENILKNMKQLKNESASIFESKHRTKDGEIKDVRVSAHVINIRNKDYLSIIWNDITEKNRNEVLLREKDLIFQSLLDNSPVHVFFKDHNIRSLYLSKNFQQMLGRPMSEIIGKDMFELFPSDLAKSMVETDRKILNEGKLVEVEEELNGRVYNTIKFPIFRNDGPPMLAGFTIDITERRNAENALRESEALYRNLVLMLPDGVYKSTHDGKFIDVNPAMVKMLGYNSKDELMAADIKNDLYFSPDDRESVVLQENKVGMGVYRLKKKDGSEIWIEDHGWYNYDENVDILFHEGIMRDVTERKRAQDELNLLNTELEQRVLQRTLQLENANKELEAFSYSVSHDLRAPLRGIDGWSLALLQDYNHQLDSQGKSYLERVRRESQRMGNLIDDLLKLSRVNRFEMKKVDVDISAIAQTIANRLIESNAGQQYEFVIQPGLTAYGDPQMLEIVLTNLLDNACKFTGKNALAKIEFGMSKIKGENTFFIKDNGVGFDMEYSKKLFGAFQRMHKQSDFPGSGIGLATVQRIISRHGGRVWADSKPGEGATFYFTSTFKTVL